MASSLLMGVDKVAEQSGYFVLNHEGAVLSSAGELENDEHQANQIAEIVHAVEKLKLSTGDEYFKRISLMYKDFILLVTVSNEKIFAVKKPLK